MDQTPTREELLTRLDALWSHFSRKVAAEAGQEAESSGDEPLTGVQILTLRNLRRRGPMTMSALAETLGVSLSAANGLIIRLVEMGLVARERDDADRRLVRVSLTDKGAERLKKGEMRRARILARYFSVLDSDELAQLVRLMEKIDHE